MSQVKTSIAELASERVFGSFVFPRSDYRCETAERFIVEAHSLPDFARGKTSAIGNNVRRHGRAQFPVTLIDVLNDTLPLIATGQVEVDVRPLAALLGEKSFEEQIHFDGIDSRDSQRVTHHA